MCDVGGGSGAERKEIAKSIAEEFVGERFACCPQLHDLAARFLMFSGAYGAVFN